MFLLLPEVWPDKAQCCQLPGQSHCIQYLPPSRASKASSRAPIYYPTVCLAGKCILWHEPIRSCILLQRLPTQALTGLSKRGVTAQNSPKFFAVPVRLRASIDRRAFCTALDASKAAKSWENHGSALGCAVYCDLRSHKTPGPGPVRVTNLRRPPSRLANLTSPIAQIQPLHCQAIWNGKISILNLKHGCRSALCQYLSMNSRALIWLAGTILLSFTSRRVRG